MISRDTTLRLNANDVATVRLALSGWAARCDAEEKVMMALANDFAPGGETALKCIRNATASATFAAEARAVLARI